MNQLALLDGPVAIVPVLFAIYCYRRYAIDHAYHERIRLGLRVRRLAQAPRESRMQHIEIGL